MATEVDVAIYGDPLGESFSEGEITPPSKEIESVQTTTSLDGVPRISDHFLGKERLNSLR